MGRAARWQTRVLDERRHACASRNDERASRETGENTRVRCVEAGARGEQLGRVATRLCEVTRVRREETKVHGERTSV